jgi:hypothetical protein
MKEILAPGVIMIKSKNIILITVIGILVIFSGCTGGQEKKVTETAPPTPAQTPVQTTIVQTTTPQALQDSYQVQVTEVRTLSDCIKSPYSSEVTPCTLINLQVKNNNVNKLDFEIVKEEVIAKYSRVLPGKYDKEVGLNDQCTRQAGMKFVLTENTQKIVGLCHPTINNADEPVLNVMAMINGVRQEYKFSLPS